MLMTALAWMAAVSGEMAPHERAQAHARVDDGVRQLVVVVTPGWDSVRGVLRRYERRDARSLWEPVGDSIPVVVGVNGLAWGADTLGTRRDPHKREGDGRSPAGEFPIGTAFGFPSARPDWMRLAYHPLDEGTECVDDARSSRYNRIVERTAVPRVDWRSSEHMRRVSQYELGAVVRYNDQPARRGRGSCIFLHIWGGPATGTAGCTAMPRPDLEAVLRWLDPERRPSLVQLTAADYAHRRSRWGLP